MAEHLPAACRRLFGRGYLALMVPLSALGCTTEAPIAAEPAEARAVVPALLAPAATAHGADVRLHTEPVTGMRFPVPATGVLVEARHFDRTLPVYKFRHSIRLVGATGTAVLIDVWDNPSQLALRPWFDAYLGFLVGERTRVSDQPMTAGRVAGILLAEPRSTGAVSQANAVFAVGEQVFRVTAINPEEDAAARAMFEQIVDQLEVDGLALGGTP